MRLALNLALSIVAGTAAFLACPSFDVWPLMWVAIVPALFVALRASTPKRAFLYGWLTGLVGNAGGFYWITGLLQRFGHMPLWEAMPIMLLLVAYQGLEFALLSWAVHRLRRRTAVPMMLLAPVVMTAIELVTPQIFPFYLGFSQAWVTPVIQIAELTGPLGVTFLVLMVNGALYDVLAAYLGQPAGRIIAWRRLGMAGAIVALVVGYGYLRIHQIDQRRAAAPHAKVGAVQANVGIFEKWDPGQAERLLATHQRLSGELERQGADLIVWPESSYPFALARTMTRDFAADDGRKIMRGFSRPLLFGAVTRSSQPQSRSDRYPYNTALMMDRDGAITGKFDKVFLLVFGEYIPYYDHIPWFTRIFPEASNFNRGEDPAVFPFDLNGRRFHIGPLICYEDILPAFTRRLTSLEPRPNVLVNITNDAWFGRTSEPYQHMALAVFRTVEHRLDMLRAVNTGVTTLIDATGRVREHLDSVDPQEEPHPGAQTLLTEIALLDAAGLYRIAGDWLGYACLLAVGWFVLRSRRKTQRSKR